jgi:hypothetical protein
MRFARQAALLLALLCSWQTFYQIGDLYGDTSRALALGVSYSEQASPLAISHPGGKDYDDWVPLTLGRTLLPAPVNAEKPDSRTSLAPSPSPAGPSRDIVVAEASRSPPGSGPPFLIEPTHLVSILAASAVFSLAPPAA